MARRGGCRDELVRGEWCRDPGLHPEDASQWATAVLGASDGARLDVAADAYQWDRRDAGAGKLADREPGARARAERERQLDC
jgi:hypothetical protein